MKARIIDLPQEGTGELRHPQVRASFCRRLAEGLAEAAAQRPKDEKKLRKDAAYWRRKGRRLEAQAQ